jgi:malonate transporter and related proteins
MSIVNNMIGDATLRALLPVYCGIGIGYAAGRFRVIENSNIQDLNGLVTLFAAPAALFIAVASRSRSDLLVEGRLLLLIIPVMLGVYSAWYAFARRGAGLGTGEAAVEALTVAFPNFAAAGFPILGALFGQLGSIHVAVSLASGSLLLAFVTLFILESDGASGTRRRSLATICKPLIKAVLKPLVLAPAVGAAISISGIELPSLAAAALQPIAQIVNGGALFLTGLVLSAQAIEVNWRISAAVMMAILLKPLATFGVASALSLPVETTNAALLLCSLPAGFFGILFAVSYGVSARSTASIIVGSTLASAVTLSLAIALTLGPFGQSHGRQLGAIPLDRAASCYQHLDHRPRVAAGLELMSETHPQYRRRATSCVS